MKNIKTIEIYSIAFGGEEAGRLSRKVCFITGALPGEKAIIEITEEKENFTAASLNSSYNL